jgi:hypothetical protein
MFLDQRSQRLGHVVFLQALEPRARAFQVSVGDVRERRHPHPIAPIVGAKE